MKILLVTRGSQGDIYPYLRLAKELERRGHFVTVNLPLAFEKQAQDAKIARYYIQGKDDICGMMEDELDTKDLLKWTNRVIGQQFKELVPLLEKHDILVGSNTEFAAPTIAEYCGKPFIRTAYGPFIPSDVIPPPVFPLPKPHAILRPAFLWSLLNAGLNMMCRKTLNIHRKKLGMPPIKDQAEHAPSNALNYLLYSPALGSIDRNWKYKWDIGGYIFNDEIPYNEGILKNFLNFIKKDNKPTLFFTHGSCTSDVRDRFTENVDEICRKHGYKLAIGCGWQGVGKKLPKHDSLFLLETSIPHCLVLPHVTAVMHHGGVGTTHSTARAGKPQMITPMFLDQWYWAYQTKLLGCGPGYINIKRISKKQLEKKIVSLMTNQNYAHNAAQIGVQVRAENGLEQTCNFIENNVDGKYLCA
ncbi:glucosyltransferase [Spirochaetia bacterium]|nr:glucosyltransferase [Spirochaetia bacterium]